jgi:hypothetical protein
MLSRGFDELYWRSTSAAKWFVGDGELGTAKGAAGGAPASVTHFA